MTAQRLPASVSIDLDDLWAYRRSFGLPDASPGGAPSLWPLALPRIAALMADETLHATLFAVGRDAALPLRRDELAALHRCGHEVANHSHEHAQDLALWAEPRLQAEVERAHDALAAACGSAPCGFRAPSFGFAPALPRVLQRLGYRYDSSVFSSSLAALARRWHARRVRAVPGAAAAAPVAGAVAHHGSAPRRPLRAFRWQWRDGGEHRELLELPVTTLPGLRLPMHGTYLMHLAQHSPAAARAYAAAALAGCRLSGTPPHLLLHAADFVGADDGLPTAFLPGAALRWADKRLLLRRLLAVLRERFDVLPMAACAERLAPHAAAEVLP